MADLQVTIPGSLEYQLVDEIVVSEQEFYEADYTEDY